MAFVVSILVFFIDHYCGGVSDKCCLLSFFSFVLSLLGRYNINQISSVHLHIFVHCHFQPQLGRIVQLGASLKGSCQLLAKEWALSTGKLPNEACPGTVWLG